MADTGNTANAMAPLEAAALTMLGLGTRFDSLCEWAATETAESEAPELAAGWLEQWIADGLLAATVD